MPGRNYTASGTGKYRFGFNGKEMDNEINVDEGSYDFGARIYDGRLGRWLSVDPLTAMYADLSTYNFVGNMPLAAVDPDGKTIKIKNKDDQIKVQSYFKELGLEGAFRFNLFGTLKVNRFWSLQHKSLLENPDIKKIHKGIKELSKGKYNNVNVHIFNTNSWSISRIDYEWDRRTNIDQRADKKIEGKNSQYISGSMDGDVVINEGKKVDYSNNSGGTVQPSYAATFIHLLLDQGLRNQQLVKMPHPASDDVAFDNSARNILGLDNRSGNDFGKEVDNIKSKK